MPLRGPGDPAGHTGGERPRHWPGSAGPYAESDFEEEYRAALKLAPDDEHCPVGRADALFARRPLPWCPEIF